MSCKEAYEYLLVYAKGQISPEHRGPLESHLKSCRKCSNMTAALKALIPQLTFAKDDETSHFMIAFEPENETLFECGHDADLEHIGEFDNEGNKIEFSLAPNLYYGHLQNSFGGNVKSALYLAIPEKPRISASNGETALLTAVPTNSLMLTAMLPMVKELSWTALF